jgi:hypothetical protein
VPKVLVLGSSHTLDLRWRFIKSAFTFYNGGRIADDIWHFRRVLERIPARSLPRYLVIGHDQYHFNSSLSSFSSGEVTPELIAQRFVPEADG